MSMPYDLSKTGRVAAMFLLAYAAAEVLFTWHSFQLFGFYDAIEGNLLSAVEMDAEAARIDGTGILVAGVFMITLIGCYIASGMWIYRAATNAQAVTPNPDAIGPGWSVGWFAVPIANFWMPYKALRQHWDGLAGSGGPSWPSWAIIWWLLWVFGNATATVGTRLNFDAQTIDQFRTATTLDVASSVLSIPAALMFRKLILDMTALSADARPATTPDLEEGQL